MAHTSWEKASFLAAWVAISLTLGGHIYEYVTTKHKLSITISSVNSSDKMVEVGLMLTNKGSFEETVFEGYLGLGYEKKVYSQTSPFIPIKFKNRCFKPVSIESGSSKLAVTNMPIELHPAYGEAIKEFPDYEKQKENFLTLKDNDTGKNVGNDSVTLPLYLVFTHSLSSGAIGETRVQIGTVVLFELTSEKMQVFSIDVNQLIFNVDMLIKPMTHIQEMGLIFPTKEKCM